MSNIVEKIKKYGERYNSSLTKIGDMLDDLADLLYEYTKDLGEIKFTYGNVTFSNYGPCSNVGCLHGAFWYTDEYEVMELASTTRTPGVGFYLHGDYHAYVSVASRHGRRTVARQLPEFLEKFAEWLSQQVDDADKEVEQLKSLVERIKGAE